MVLFNYYNLFPTPLDNDPLINFTSLLKYYKMVIFIIMLLYLTNNLVMLCNYCNLFITHLDNDH